MKGLKLWKKGMFCVSIVAIEVFLYLSISRYITRIKIDAQVSAQAEEARYFRTENEFLRTIDCAELFDAYPEQLFEVKFEICAEKPGEVLVYQQNGSDYRYTFAQKIDVTEEYKEFSLIVEPILVDETIESSYLAFYGQYGSGVVPTVRDISIVPVEQ